MSHQDQDFLTLFAEEPPVSAPNQEGAGWKVLLVDDEPDIHAVLRLALNGVEVKGQPLILLDANSADEARQLLLSHPETALILLDVVMETENAGLELVRFVREDLGRHTVQIILVTGQPGYAPERQVIARHEIDGYRLKSELTLDRIYFSVLSALRTHAALTERDHALARQRLAQVEILRHRDALAQANQVLESRIAERTAMLHLRNRELESDRKALAALMEKVELAERQLLHSDKMATIGQLAAGVAHEINNPVGFVSSNLSVLSLYAQRLLDVLAAYESGQAEDIARARDAANLAYLQGDIQDLVRESQDGLERVKRIVADLKGISRRDESAFQDADLNLILESTLNVVWNEIKYKAEVVRQLAPLPNVPCNPAQISQVLMNILVNAAQAMDNYGTITLRSGESADHVWLEIQDSGKGMTEEVRRRVCEPFFTTKPPGQGTGLGMSISHDIIVKRHAGRLDITSEPGQGSTFRISLSKCRGDALPP